MRPAQCGAGRLVRVVPLYEIDDAGVQSGLLVIENAGVGVGHRQVSVPLNLFQSVSSSNSSRSSSNSRSSESLLNILVCYLLRFVGDLAVPQRQPPTENRAKLYSGPASGDYGSKGYITPKRRRRQASAIATQRSVSGGLVVGWLQIPAPKSGGGALPWDCCGQCGRMASGADRPGEAERQQRAASFGYGAGAVQNNLPLGTAQPGVAAAGKDGRRMDTAQPAGIAPKPGPHKPNHLKRNAALRFSGGVGCADAVAAPCGQ